MRKQSASVYVYITFVLVCARVNEREISRTNLRNKCTEEYEAMQPVRGFWYFVIVRLVIPRKLKCQATVKKKKTVNPLYVSFFLHRIHFTYTLTFSNFENPTQKIF